MKYIIQKKTDPIRKLLCFLTVILTLCSSTILVACSNNDTPTEQDNITPISDKVWTFSQSHPDGFTLDIRTMTEPTEGIAVSYAETQNSHSRDKLEEKVDDEVWTLPKYREMLFMR